MGAAVVAYQGDHVSYQPEMVVIYLVAAAIYRAISRRRVTYLEIFHHIIYLAIYHVT